MKRKYYIIILLLITGILFLQLFRMPISETANQPHKQTELRLETKASKKDGKIDNWIYRDKNNVPVKWLRDANRNGRPDKWSFFKNGRAFLDQEDTDHDGKVDIIYITIGDSQGIKQRSFSFAVQDKETNVFLPGEDTGWKSEDNILKNEKSR